MRVALRGRGKRGWAFAGAAAVGCPVLNTGHPNPPPWGPSMRMPPVAYDREVAPVPDADRTTALTAAVAFHAAVDDLGLRVGVDGAETVRLDEIAVLNTAETFLAWLRGPASIHLLAGAVLDQTTGLPTGTLIEGDSVQIHDNEQFDLTVDTKDAKGFETQDQVTWSSSDETVAALVVAEDTRTATVVAGTPGSAVITVSDGALSVTEAVDVVPAGTATIAVVEGPVTAQP